MKTKTICVCGRETWDYSQCKNCEGVTKFLRDIRKVLKGVDVKSVRIPMPEQHWGQFEGSKEWNWKM